MDNQTPATRIRQHIPVQHWPQRGGRNKRHLIGTDVGDVNVESEAQPLDGNTRYWCVCKQGHRTMAYASALLRATRGEREHPCPMCPHKAAPPSEVRKQSIEREAKAKEMLANNVPFYDIRKALGVSACTLRKYLRGLTRPALTTCSYCHKEGHQITDCATRKEEQKDRVSVKPCDYCSDICDRRPVKKIPNAAGGFDLVKGRLCDCGEFWEPEPALTTDYIMSLAYDNRRVLP